MPEIGVCRRGAGGAEAIDGTSPSSLEEPGHALESPPSFRDREAEGDA